jgi:hypothetical protein
LNPEQLQLPFDAPEHASDIFARAFRRIHPRKPMPVFHVEYREWAQLRSAIRVREHGIEVRISDILLGVSPAVIEALAEILLSRLNRRPPSPEARARYLACVLSPAIKQRAEEAGRRRGFKLMLPPAGKQFNLDEIFADLNARLFKGRLPQVKLGWSVQRSRAILGHHDPAHGAITISRILDSPRVPRLLVEFIVYHEMLHVQFPVERNHHRRVVHSRDFHEAEKRFPEYEQARRLLRSGRWGRNRESDDRA